MWSHFVRLRKATPTPTPPTTPPHLPHPPHPPSDELIFHKRQEIQREGKRILASKSTVLHYQHNKPTDPSARIGSAVLPNSSRVCPHEATEMCIQCRPVFRHKIHDPALNTILPSPTLGADYCSHATLSIQPSPYPQNDAKKNTKPIS